MSCTPSHSASSSAIATVTDVLRSGAAGRCTGDHAESSSMKPARNAGRCAVLVVEQPRKKCVKTDGKKPHFQRPWMTT